MMSKTQGTEATPELMEYHTMVNLFLNSDADPSQEMLALINEADVTSEEIKHALVIGQITMTPEDWVAFKSNNGLIIQNLQQRLDQYDESLLAKDRLDIYKTLRTLISDLQEFLDVTIARQEFSAHISDTLVQQLNYFFNMVDHDIPELLSKSDPITKEAVIAYQAELKVKANSFLEDFMTTKKSFSYGESNFYENIFREKHYHLTLDAIAAVKGKANTNNNVLRNYLCKRMINTLHDIEQMISNAPPTHPDEQKRVL